jgi:hypothetical protein
MRAKFIVLFLMFSRALLAAGECTLIESNVSKDSCNPNHQCGTISLPFCSIEQGIRVGGKVRVASSKTPYEETLTLRDGVEIEGGYPPSFAGPEASHETIVKGSLIFPKDVHSTIRHLSVEQVAFPCKEGTPPPAIVDALTVAGSAVVRLEGVRVNVREIDQGSPVGKDVSAVSVREGSGGMLKILGGEFRSLPALGISSAFSVYSPKFSLVISEATLVSGTAKRSVAVGFWGEGLLDVKRASLRTSFGFASAGIRAVGKSPDALTVSVAESIIEGNPRETYVPPDFSDLTPSHYGIAVRNASLEVRGSDIVASFAGDSKSSRGIESISNVPSHLTVEENQRIAGGVAGGKWEHGRSDASGVVALGSIDAKIHKNKRIEGCLDERCPVFANGVLLHDQIIMDDYAASTWEDFPNTLKIPSSGSSHWEVIKNERISGGGGSSVNPHVGVNAASGFSSTLILRENPWIVGNPEAKSGAELNAIGLWTRAVNITATGNRFAAGPTEGSRPYGAPESAGVNLQGRESPVVDAVLRKNSIEGSAFLMKMRARVEFNFIHHGSVGLSFHSDAGSVYANNIIVAQNGAIAGCSSYNQYYEGCGPQSDYTFAHNLCFATDSNRGWALLSAARSSKSRIVNNILDAKMPVLIETQFSQAPAAMDHNIVFSRDPSRCAFWKFGSFSCDDKAARVLSAEANISIDPIYIGPLSTPWRPGNFAPTPACALKGTGILMNDLKTDFEGRLRRESPNAGPFECF